MDLLLSFFFLIISSVVGITLGLLLGMTSYLKLAIFVICIFIPIELCYDYFYDDIYTHYNSTTATLHNSNSNSNLNEIQPINTMSINKKTNKEKIKYASVENTSVLDYDNDKPPFDGLEPTELLSRLNYIYYATANPLEPIRYSTYKTHADKLLDKDSNTNSISKLSTNDPKLLKYSRKYYPQLTDNQIDAKDCLNYGSGKESCFQNPSLFFNIKNDFNILTKGVNENNANLVVREDFCNPPTSMSMNPNTRYETPLFSNAPDFKLDKPLDQESNETINLDTTYSMCRNCKLAVCTDDYCSLQNQLFL
jgi:hypothetical protein